MLEDFLNAKPLFYDAIDYTRMPRIYDSIKSALPLPHIIHIIGTNGKGTTGRFLASALYSKGLSVGHYTSPHILDFSERIWINGENSSNEALEIAHKELLSLLTKQDADSLSYFEYTTLLAMLVYKDCEYVVLEAGLGGEHDATAVFTNILTLVTPIDKDHEAFLGNSIAEIAKTKLNAVQKNAIVARQKHKDVQFIIDELLAQKMVNIKSLDFYLDRADTDKISKIAKANALVTYLEENLTLAVSALKFLKIPYSVEDFENSRLFGRLTRVSENIIVDVGHNTLAASSIVQSLKGTKYTLIYNSYRDKNYKEILRILEPIVNDVAIITIDDERIEEYEKIEKTVHALGMKYTKFTACSSAKNYLVFGSFSVVEAFLKARSE